MKVLINNNQHYLGEPIKFGGEGDIYLIEIGGEKKCVKVYYPEKRTPYNEKKIYILINKFKKISFGGIEKYLGFPEFPVYDLNKNFCGFLMKYFPDHYQLSELKFSNNNLNYGNERIYDDDSIFKLCDNLFFYLKILHRAGLILGDINPENILIDSALTPCIVDFDSVQVGSFYSNSHRKDYIDPSVRVDGNGQHKYFIYSTDSDIYALAIIFYELIVGPLPHYFATTDPRDSFYKKSIDLSFLDYYLNNKSKILSHGLTLDNNIANESFAKRLHFLQEFHPNIFNYLKSVFSEGKRYYFYYKQNRPINVHKKDGVLEFNEVELITQSKEDPNELELFMKQFDLRLP
jgi:serine/threonine protein kinase